MIPCWTFDGRLEDISDLGALIVDWRWIASTLAGMPRFGKKYPGAALSVAQHCVMGADALHRETGMAGIAGYFLLHDAHEYLLTDLPVPVVRLIAHFVEKRFPCAYRNGGRVERGIDDLKRALDGVIYPAAGLMPPGEWPEDAARHVKTMDTRMGEAEALALYGPQAFAQRQKSALPPPPLTAPILPPWGVAKAEEAFLERLGRYCGIDTRNLP
jgi:hypothetical protein